MMQIPTSGLLTDGICYKFYKCTCGDHPRLTCSKTIKLHLQSGMTQAAAVTEVKKVVPILVQLILDQRDALEAFTDLPSP